MTALLSRIPAVRRSRAPAVLPSSPQATALTVTAHLVWPGVAVVAVRGEVDLFTSPLLMAALLAQLRCTCPRLVIDLTEVSFFGAAGLTTLLTARQSATGVGVSVCVVARTRVVLRPLAITGMGGAFDVHPYLPHALCCLGG